MTADDHPPDDSDDGSVSAERLPPEEAFGLVGHEIRFGILEALNDADDEQQFSELREAVGVRDPGQFNYHLSELTGRFVRKTDDGYRLAAAGRQVVGAVLSGGITKAMDARTIETGAACLECGADMEAHFREDGIAVECPVCGLQYTDPDVPPGVVEGRPRESVAAVLDLWSRRNRMSADFGFCQYCDGPMDQTVVLPGEDAAPDWFEPEMAAAEGLEATAVYECSRCGYWWHAILEIAMITHPAVIGFHYDHGIDLRETPAWDLPWIDGDLATVVDEDPLRVEVPAELDDERLVCTFDRDLTLVEERREPV